MNLKQGWIYQEGVAYNTMPDTSNSVYNYNWLKSQTWGYQTVEESLHILKAIRKLSDIKTVIDIGCGGGKLVHILSKYKYNAVGIDKQPEAIEAAKSYARGAFIVLDITNPELQPYTVIDRDLVIMAHTLEHFIDPITTLLKVKKFLKPDGYILITVPNLWAYQQDTWRSIATANVLAPEHMTAYAPHGLIEKLIISGFDIQVITTHTYPYQILTGLYRNMINKLNDGNGGSPTKRSEFKVQLLQAIPEWITTIPDRLSERNLRGVELMVVAKRVD